MRSLVPTQRYFRVLNLAVLGLFVCYLGVLSFGRPFYNLDMVMYTAISESIGDRSYDEVFERVWNDVKKRVSPEKFEDLCCGNAIRQGRFDDFSAARSQFPRFEIKLGYIWLLRFFSLFISPIDATLLISFLGSVLIAGSTVAAFSVLPGIYRFLWLPSLLVLQLPEIARFSTPDAITIALFAAATLCVIKKWLYFAVIVVLTGVLIRPDDIVICIGFAIYLCFIGHRNLALVTVVGASIIYFCIVNSVEYIGWWNHFYTSLVEKQVSLKEFNVPFDLTVYVLIVVKNTLSAITSSNWVGVGLFILVFVGGMMENTNHSRASKEEWFIYLMLGSVLVHFMAFPVSEDRVQGPGLYAAVLFLPQFVRAKLENRAHEEIIKR